MFVISFDGMLGTEALVVLTQLSQTMAEKMDKPILHVQRWINGQITIVVTISYLRMIRES